jgi:hypothetical protein
LLGRRDHEERVGKRAAAGRASRRVGHGGRVRVETDHERVGARRGGREDGSTVAGPEIESYPVVALGATFGLADVDVLNVTAGDNAEHRSKCSGLRRTLCK